MDLAKLLSHLRSCTNSRKLIQTKSIHQKIITSNQQTNFILSKNLIDNYLSFQHHESANHVLQSTQTPIDISLWNTLMASYARNFMFIQALDLFQILLLSNHPFLKPDSYTYPSLLKACGGLGRVILGEMIHTNLIKHGFGSDIVVSSSLLGMYGKCNEFDYAKKVFDEMPEKDVVCWNTVISCYYQNGKPEKALEMFEEMKEYGLNPSSVTLMTVISACGRVLDLEKGKKIYKEAMEEKGGEIMVDDCVKSSLVDLYAKCGCLETAYEVFEQIRTKNVIVWNSIIAGFGSKGGDNDKSNDNSKKSIELFDRMIIEGIQPSLTTLTTILVSCSRSYNLRHGKFIHGYLVRNKVDPDIFLENSLIDMYFKCDRVRLAENVFKLMSKRDVVSWNAMISGYVKVGDYFDAICVYDAMNEACVKPNAITLTSTLSACSQLAALGKGIRVHSCVIENELENDEIIIGALLDMYAKCGHIEEAARIFRRQQTKNNDTISWTTMIAAYGSNGRGKEAVKLFSEMKKSNVKVDGVTFVAVLSACSHGKMVDEGFRCFNEMITEYGIKPKFEHYSCLIDLLGRAGLLHEAYSILRGTAEIRDNVELLSTLFFACLLHRDYELGGEIANSIMEKGVEDGPSSYIVLSNMYASVRRWDEMGMVRLKMKELGLRKSRGYSSIEIDDRIESFFVEDTSHREGEMIYECLAILGNHMDVVTRQMEGAKIDL